MYRLIFELIFHFIYLIIMDFFKALKDPYHILIFLLSIYYKEYVIFIIIFFQLIFQLKYLILGKSSSLHLLFQNFIIYLLEK